MVMNVVEMSESMRRNVQWPISAVSTLQSRELTARCPLGGDTDFYTITVKYAPDRLLLEMRSFPLYLQEFRERAIFAEDLAYEIQQTLWELLRPRWLEVTLNEEANTREYVIHSFTMRREQ